jgi:hypothetical protein
MMNGMTHVIIADQNAPNRRSTCASHDIAETIAPWFPQAPDEVRDAIEGLQHAVIAGEYHGELAAYLGVRIGPA